MAVPLSAFVQLVDPTSTRATYSYQLKDFTPAATPTDFLTIAGAAGKVVRITRIRIGADATAIGEYDFYCYKRTAANTGGTATNPTGAIHDSQDPAASAVISLYSVNPSGLGTGVLIRAEPYALPAATTTGYPFSPIVWFEGTSASKPPVLRAGELLSISGNGNGYPAGLSLYCLIEWTEDVI